MFVCVCAGGGIGGRGPGETKLEIDRRRARDRITWLEQALERAERQRSSQRSRRQRRGVTQIALVGYTNAGKSTLFNQLTRSDVLAEDKLFATLHVTTRRLRLSAGEEVLFTDTVGFIRDLPQDLVAAFKATLEELRESVLLLHIVDIADPRRAEQISSVDQILSELELADRRRILVFNKTDQLSPEVSANLCELHGALPVQATDRQSSRSLLASIEGALLELEEERAQRRIPREKEPWELP